ncbi:MAG: hypothetical protein MZV64_15055 [Ignavibacteriales bacterium]|nr:hypothetical protein [Ignavibacteriales bacterium]
MITKLNTFEILYQEKGVDFKKVSEYFRLCLLKNVFSEKTQLAGQASKRQFNFLTCKKQKGTKTLLRKSQGALLCTKVSGKE